MNLWTRTLGGLFWGYGAFAGERLLGLLSTAVLARILYPSDFGVLAFALLVLGYIDTFRDFGIKDALIYRSDRVEDAADTAATMSVAIGVLQCIAAVLAAPLALYFIDDERLVSLIRVLSVVFVINALSMSQDGLLQKQLSFRSRYVSDLLAAVIKTIVMITMALFGCGLWSVAAGHLVGASVRTAARWYLIAWRPKPRFDPDCARDLWRFGKHILFVNIIGTLSTHADQLAVTLLLGPVSLAYYFIAARIPDLMVGSFSVVLTRILFPVYASIKEDKTKLTTAFCTSTRFTAIMVVPISTGLVAVAPDLVPVLFGTKWSPSVPILQMLALAGLAEALGWCAGDVFKAIGRPGLQTYVACVHCLIRVPLVFLLTWLVGAPEMAALGCLVALLVSSLLRLWLVARLLRLAAGQIVGLYLTAACGGGAILLSVELFRSAFVGGVPYLMLAASVAVGIASYVPIIWWLEKPALRRLVEIMRDLVRPGMGPRGWTA